MGNLNNIGTTTASQSNARRRSFRIRRQLQWLRPDSGNNGSLVLCEPAAGECPVCCQPTDTLLCYTSCHVYKEQQAGAKKQVQSGRPIHSACRSCWLTFISTAIDEFAFGRLTCIGCETALSPAVTLHLLQKHASEKAEEPVDSPCGVCHRDCLLMLSRYDDFILRKSLVRERNMRWCPYGCGYGVLALGFKACPRMQCLRRDCGHDFCFICQRPWLSGTGAGALPATVPTSSSSDPVEPDHECTVETSAMLRNRGALADLFSLNRSIITTIAPRPATSSSSTGQEHRSDLNPVGVVQLEAVERSVGGEELTSVVVIPSETGESGRSSSDHSSGDEGNQSAPSKVFLVDRQGHIKPCPNCRVLIEKTEGDGCNAVKCSICLETFCWLCERPLSAVHYLSFSGCTMWGQRRWTVRRRIWAYIATLILAPFALPFFAIFLIFFCLICVPCRLLCYPPEEISSRTGRIVAAVFCIFITPLVVVLFVPVAMVLLLFYVYVFLFIHLVLSIRQSYREDRERPKEGVALFDRELSIRSGSLALMEAEERDVEAGTS